eukprot:XP_762918.1 hypothetical protein [Theileria parva strain Muguga]
MNINNSLLLSLGYGLISSHNSSECITHLKKSSIKLRIPLIRSVNLGYISPCLTKFNQHYHSTPSDSTPNNPSNETTDNNSPSEGIVSTDRADINEELSSLISAQSEILKREGDKDDLRKYDWFEDVPMDSSDEELMTEYYETKIPSMNTIYKNLDPVGIRNYLPDTPRSDRCLGRVYEVGETFLDTESQNTHTLQEILDKAKKNREEHNRICGITSTDSPEDDIKLNSLLTNNQPDDTVEREYYEKFEGEDEFGFGKEFQEDSADVVLEDEMCRYFLEVPLKNWVKDEINSYNDSLNKLEKAQKYYTENAPEEFVTDFRAVFSDSPISTTGLFDSNSPAFDGSTDKIAKNSSESKDLYIKEYKHNDLLNDIDKYESSKYPEIVLKMAENDQNNPIFTIDDRNPVKVGTDKNSMGSLEDNLRVYVSVPKEFIKFDEVGSVVVNDSIAFRRNYDICIGQTVEKIPLEGDFFIGTILLPNQAGYRDQNIRYLADEIAINSKGLVFVPDIPIINQGDEWYFVLLNRLLKLVQSAYKVDRISFVALGDQANLIINYINNSMLNTISKYSNFSDNSKVKKNEEVGKKMDQLIERFSTERMEELMRRQSVPIIEDLLNGLENIKLVQSHQEAKKAKEVNLVKPLSKVLQSLILYDSTHVDLEKLTKLSIPTLLLESNRTNLIDQVLKSDSVTEEMISNFISSAKANRYNIVKNKHKGINMFDYVINEMPKKLKTLMNNQTDFRLMPSEHNTENHREQYLLTTFHRGVDIVLEVFKEASSHFYMKKPNASKLELQVPNYPFIYYIYNYFI